MQIPVSFARDTQFWSVWATRVHDHLERERSLAHVAYYLGMIEEFYLEGIISSKETRLRADDVLRGDYDKLGWMIDLFYAQIMGARNRDELWSAWIGYDGIIKCMERTQHALLEQSFDLYETMLPRLLDEPEELSAYCDKFARPYALPRAVHQLSAKSRRFGALTRWCQRNEVMTYGRPNEPLEYVRTESHYARRIVFAKKPRRALNDEEIFRLPPHKLNRVIDFMSAQLLGSSSRITSFDRFFIIDGLSLRGEKMGVITPAQSRARFKEIQDHLLCVCEPGELIYFIEKFQRPYLG